MKLIITLVIAILMASVTKADSNVQESDLSVYLPWIDGWKIVESVTRERTGKILGSVTFCRNGDESFILTGSIAGVNQVLRSAVVRKEKATFLKEEFIDLLLIGFFEPSSHVVTDRFLADYKANIRYGGTVTSLEKLERFRLEPYANIREGRWTLGVNVLNPRGGVEKWTFSGPIEPLGLSRVTGDLELENGSIQTIMAFGR